MRRSKWLSAFSLLFALMLLAAACAEDEEPSGGGGGDGEDPSAACDEDEFGCIEIAEGDPITIGTLLVITTENASLGLDSQHGVELGADYYADQSFEGEPADVL